MSTWRMKANASTKKNWSFLLKNKIILRYWYLKCETVSLLVLNSCAYNKFIKMVFCFFQYSGQSCSTNCLHNSCDNNAHCTAGCIDGYWGETCEKTCPLNCKDRSCNRYDGHCVSCKLYYWGSNCTLFCSNNCFEQTCNIQSGFCNHGCTEGRYGEMCQEICSPGCAGRTCEQTGTCMNGCIQNWAGARCNSK